jgi:hypothetical protein
MSRESQIDTMQVVTRGGYEKKHVAKNTEYP